MNEQIDQASKAMGQVIAKAWQDEAFLDRLKSDPRAVLKEQGIDLPAGAAPKVIQAQPGEVHIVIPPKPDRELSDEELQATSGASTIVTMVTAFGACR